MTSPLHIRWAHPDDLAWIAERESEYALPDLEHKMVHQRLIVACVGDARVGYARLEHLWHHVPFISWIVVDDTHRSRGIGTAIVRWLRLELEALLDGREPYLWSSTEPENVRAQQWHLRIGFEEAGYLAGINPGGTGEIFYRMKLGDSLEG